MTDDVKDTGVRTDRASVEAHCETLVIPQTVAILRALLAERDAAIARAEALKLELIGMTSDRDHYMKRAEDAEPQLAESQSQNDALRAAIIHAVAGIASLHSPEIRTERCAGEFIRRESAIDIMMKLKASTKTGNGGLKPKEGG